jgi:hypothetical protein
MDNVVNLLPTMDQRKQHWIEGQIFKLSQFLLSEIHSLFTGRRGLIEQQSNMAIRLTSYSGNKQQPKCLTKIANAKFSLDWFEILWPGAIKATLLVT